MAKDKPAVSEEARAEAFERVKAALPRGVTARRDAGAERNRPSHLCIMLKRGETETPWTFDLVRQELTEEVLAGFKISEAHRKAAGE